jgi:hypothetical protein
MPDWTTAINTLVTVTLGGIGGAAGFTHTHDWANALGQHGWLSWADAVVIEGMAIVAGFEIHRDPKAMLPKIVLVVAFLVQMTAQVSQAEKSPAGWLVAAMPALGFLTVVKLRMRRLPAAERPAVEPTPPAPVAPTATPAPTSPPAPRPQPEPRPAITMSTRLPASMRETITEVTTRAHQQGRPVTADDIRRTAAIPDGMLTQLVAELNATINGHSINPERTDET